MCFSDTRKNLLKYSNKVFVLCYFPSLQVKKSWHHEYISAHPAWTLAVPNLSCWSPRRPWGRPPPGQRAFQSSSLRLSAAGPGSAPPAGRTGPPPSARQSHKEPEPTLILRTPTERERDMAERERDMAEVTPYAYTEAINIDVCLCLLGWIDG